jgi:hypothetical protein
MDGEIPARPNWLSKYRYVVRGWQHAGWLFAFPKEFTRNWLVHVLVSPVRRRHLG